MLSVSPDRSTGLFGFLFVGTFLVWLVAVADGPMFTASSSKVGEYLIDGGGVVRVAGFILAIGVVLFLFPFAARLRRLIEADSENDWLGIWLMAALLLASLMMVLDVALGISVGLTSGPSADLVDWIWNLSKTINGSFIHTATGVWVAVASFGLRRVGAIPRWVGSLGIALLAPQMIAGSWLLTGEFTPLHNVAGGIGQLGAFLVWIPAVSGVSIRRTRQVREDDPRLAGVAL